MRIGIDLGGSKIEGVVLNDAGELLHRQRIATPAGDYIGTLQAIVELVNKLEHCLGQSASIGIGTPGSISPLTNLLRNSNSVCMNGQPLKQDLEKLLAREIRISNDANCFALSEAVDGAAQGAQLVFGVIIGTGTGAGVVINGKVLTGGNAIAGEWGHNPLPWPNEHELPGPNCYCGKQGCLETFLSGPGLSADFKQSSEQSKSAKEIVMLAAAGDVLAEKCLQRYEDRLARGLASVINVLDPEVIVLGGGMSNIGRLYDNVPEIWGKYIFSDVVSTRLVAPVYGDSSGVRGAAWLWD